MVIPSEHGCLGWQPAFDQPGRCRRLHYRLAAGPAGVLGASCDQHPELGRHDVETLRHILADPMHQAPTARADGALHIDHRLDARPMRRQLAAVDPTPGGAHFALGRSVCSDAA